VSHVPRPVVVSCDELTVEPECVCCCCVGSCQVTRHIDPSRFNPFVDEPAPAAPSSSSPAYPKEHLASAVREGLREQLRSFLAVLRAVTHRALRDGTRSGTSTRR
jgi:hypothetical protein